MDAVSRYSTTPDIRAHAASGMEVSPGRLFTYAEQPKPEIRPIPDEVRQKAMDAVSHPEIQARVRLANDNDVFAPSTPSWQSRKIAEKIAGMQIDAQNVDRTHREITRDGFGREYG